MDELHNSLGHERECVVACPYLTSIFCICFNIFYTIYTLLCYTIVQVVGSAVLHYATLCFTIYMLYICHNMLHNAIGLHYGIHYALLCYTCHNNYAAQYYTMIHDTLLCYTKIHIVGSVVCYTMLYYVALAIMCCAILHYGT